MLHPPIFLHEDPIDGANASHFIGHIRLWKKAREPAAILFQEVVEWQFLTTFRLAVLATLLSIGFFVLSMPTNIQVLWVTASLIATVLSTRFSVVHPLRREMELRGKMCETAAAHKFYGVNYDQRLHSEAASLLQYNQFKGWELDRIKAAMVKKQGYAEKKTASHEKWILKWKDKLT